MQVKVLSVEAYEALTNRIMHLRKTYDQELEAVRQDRLYSGEEVCELLGICRSTLANHRWSGKIGYIKVGIRCLYRWSDLEPLIGSRFIKIARYGSFDHRFRPRPETAL